MGDRCDTDINECDETNPNVCLKNEDCINGNGTYRCKCKGDYYTIGGKCMKKYIFRFSDDEENPFGSRVQAGGTELPISFPYFDNVFKYIYAHRDGFVSFGVDAMQNYRYAPKNEYWPTYPPLVGIYWTSLDIDQTNGGGMYVRKEDRSHNVSANSKFWEQLESAVNNTNFKPLAAVAFTWIDAHPFPIKHYPEDKLRAQVIFASDGIYTYMVRNYDITWPVERKERRSPASYAFSGKHGGKKDVSPSSITGEGNRLVDKLFDEEKATSSQAFTCFKNAEDLKSALGDPKPSISPCPCLKRQAIKDPNYKTAKDDSCYENRFFINKWKQKCCYDSSGLLQKNDKTAMYPKPEDKVLEDSYKKAYTSCCDVSSSFLCSSFYKEFPSDDCSAYSFNSGGGGGFGDPHIINFDGDKFTFNIVGDFTLLKLSHVEIQGRTSKSSVNTTYFSAFAFKIKDSPSYIIKVNELGSSLEGNWTDPSKKPDETIFQVESKTDNVQFFAKYDNASTLSMEVTRKNQALSYVINVDGETDGLLGNNNNQKDDDFKGVAGPAENLSPEQIQDFAKQWQVKKPKSLFGTPLQSEELPPPPNGLNEVKKALKDVHGANDTWTEVCADDLFCLQDFYTTNDINSAKEIKKESEKLQNETEDIPNPVPFNNDDDLVWHFEEGNITLTLRAPGASSYEMIPDVSCSGFHLNSESLEVDLSALRNCTKYPMRLEILGKNSDGQVIASYAPRIKLCLCERKDHCLEQTSLSEGGDPNGNVLDMKCNCGNEKEGRYCEKDLRICSKCPFECNQTLDDPCLCQENFQKGDAGTCYEIDECQDNNGGCAQICTNIVGSYDCSCRKGYEANGTDCYDIKECEDPQSCTEDKFCVEEVGSFSCQCFPGFGGKNCTRAPYRILGNLTVADCTWKEEYNNRSSHGFKEFSKKLTSVIELLIQKPMNLDADSFYVEIASLSPMDNNSTFEAVFVINSHSKIDEESLKKAVRRCTGSKGICTENGIKFNKFTLDDVNKICELPNLPNSCDVSSTTCKMEDNQNRCSCKKGFEENERDPFFCQDRDECETPGKCGKHPCSNTLGAYICDCARDETWNYATESCVAFPDPCSSNPCRNGGSCEDSDGKPVCLCSYGWEGKFCDDEEEEASRMKVAVIAISSVLGALSLILIIVLAVLCYRMHKTVETSTESSLEYTGSHKIPRPKMSSQTTGNGSSAAYDYLEEHSVASKNEYVDVRPDYDEPRTFPYTYQNKAYDREDNS